jgi:uncharacterized protein YabE (DUF348 family)
MTEKLMALVASIVLLVSITFIGCNEFNTSSITVQVKLKKEEDPFKTLKSILPQDSGIVEVHEVNRIRNEYKITIKTKRRKDGLLQFLRQNNSVEKVEDCSK